MDTDGINAAARLAGHIASAITMADDLKLWTVSAHLSAALTFLQDVAAPSSAEMIDLAEGLVDRTSPGIV